MRSRQQHGASELLDEIVAAKPEVDRARGGSPAEYKAHGLVQLREAIAVLEQKVTSQEVGDYRRFVLADRVASAHGEDGVDVSPPEQAALAEIEAALKKAEAG